MSRFLRTLALTAAGAACAPACGSDEPIAAAPAACVASAAHPLESGVGNVSLYLDAPASGALDILKQDVSATLGRLWGQGDLPLVAGKPSATDAIAIWFRLPQKLAIASAASSAKGSL